MSYRKNLMPSDITPSEAHKATVVEGGMKIVYCKDCEKHNKGVGDLVMWPDGKWQWIWKDEACPLVSWRGKAQGHEFDYQYCVYGKERGDTDEP